MRTPIIEYFDEHTIFFLYHNDATLLWKVIIDLLNIWRSLVPEKIYLQDLWEVTEPFYDPSFDKFEVMFRWKGKKKENDGVVTINLEYYNIDARVLEWFTPLSSEYIFGELF